MAYWTQPDLEARLSREVVLSILDDNNDGTADAGTIARLQEDSDAYVDGFLRGVYDLDVVRATPPPQVKRLSLDVATAYAWKRWPTIARGSWTELLETARRELVDIRAGRVTLGVTSAPEPHAATAAHSWAGDDDFNIAPEPFFNGPGRMGDF